MTDLVTIQKNEPVVSTEDLAAGFEIPHRNILILVGKYEKEFSEFGTIAFEMRKSGGKSVRFCYLNEEHSAFLITLLRASPKIIPFKVKLTKEFFRMKRAIAQIASQKQNAEWLEKRQTGKLTRRQETDTIRAFVAYAISQGSQSANKYYMNISKMQNQALFMLEQKFPNVRDVLNLNQLSTIECADRIVSNALVDGMARGIHYKDIYQLAKNRIEAFSEIHGKTLIPSSQLQGSAQKQLTMEVAA